jgi:uncharacterized membrane protein YeaQ/YmgE (transglycosylase-associated protein family)
MAEVINALIGLIPLFVVLPIFMNLAQGLATGQVNITNIIPQMLGAVLVIAIFEALAGVFKRG